MNQITILQKTTLDKVVYSHYGELGYFKEVLEANPHLKNKLILDVGDVITLPIFPKKEVTKAKRLWD